MEDKGQEVKTGYTTPSRSGEYARVVKLLPRAIERLAELLESKNPNIAMGAVNSVLDRTIPKIKGLELNNGVDENGKSRPFQLFINTGSGFIPANIQFNAPSNRSAPTEQQTVQDVNLAPESTQDNNSNIRSSEAGSS